VQQLQFVIHPSQHPDTDTQTDTQTDRQTAFDQLISITQPAEVVRSVSIKD